MTLSCFYGLNFRTVYSSSDARSIERLRFGRRLDLVGIPGVGFVIKPRGMLGLVARFGLSLGIVDATR